MAETDRNWTFERFDPGAKHVNTEREFRCGSCNARCTLGTDRSTEYGHRYACPNRPAKLPGRLNKR